MKVTTPLSTCLLTSLMAVAFVVPGSNTAAQNITIADPVPSINFEDTSVADDGNEWLMTGLDEQFQVFNYPLSGALLNARPPVRSVSLGFYAEAIGSFSLALGDAASAGGDDSAGVGKSASSGGFQSVAFGASASSGGAGSTALGAGANSPGLLSTAVGATANSQAENSIALGAFADSSGLNSIALGNYAFSIGDYSMALGDNVLATGAGGTALGRESGASALNTTALGTFAIASGNNSTALGYRAIAPNINTIVLGQSNGVGAGTEYTAVAVGTDDPLAPLHIFRDDGTAQILVEEANTDPIARTLFRLASAGSNAKFEIENTMAGESWAFTNSGIDFRMSRQGSGVVEFRVDNNGNAFIAGDLEVGGNLLSNVNMPSDRNLKQNIQEISPETVLAKVTALPLSAWEYTDRPGEKHMGPMAQDFHAAFGLGRDEKSISTVDAAGVVMASIQALAKENRELRDELNEMKALLTQLLPKTAQN